jgi:serine/threonine-protein kinase
LLRDESARSQTCAHGNGSECLTEDEILTFAAGQLSTQQVQLVDRHLSRCDACSQLLAEVLRDSHGSEWQPQKPAQARVFSPATLVAGRFVVRRLVGRGGMGEVYEALDRRRQRVVALKTVIATHCDSLTEMDRLTSELRAASQIKHPNVCRAHATGVHWEHRPRTTRLRFLTLDFIDGQTLGQRVRQPAALELPEIRGIARAVLLGLQATHAAGFVHLDVKCDNVMLPFLPRAPRAVIIDFGLAQRIGRAGALRGSVGCRGGTVAYMSPEQLLDGPCGPHTDIFGLGVLLFEMLTGTPPFSCQHGSLATTQRLERLPLCAARTRRDVPAALDAFIARCSRADPRERFADAADAMKHFERVWA